MVEGQEGVTWTEWVALARTCEAHGIPKLFRSDHYLNSAGSRSEGRSMRGARCARWRRSPRSCGSARSSRPPPSATRPSWPSSSRLPTGSQTAASSSDSEPAGTTVSTRRTASRSPTCVPEWTCWRNSSRSCSAIGRARPMRRSRSTASTTPCTSSTPSPSRCSRPHPPLLIGGSGGRRSCELAARYADEYNTVYPTLEDVATRRERLARACEAAGRPMLPFSVMTAVLVGADEAELGDRAARLEQRIGLEAGSLLRDPPSGWVDRHRRARRRAAAGARGRGRRPRLLPAPAARRPRRGRADRRTARARGRRLGSAGVSAGDRSGHRRSTSTGWTGPAASRRGGSGTT